ncbi:MAG: hypothetical protein CMJ58_16050 [Planctomycetaceae bacterium]|nr:hypothetical protein [Planctomycetaceae bacterium]
MSRMTAFLIGLALAACCSHCAQADTFGSGAHAFEIELVTIGAPGNAADTTGAPNPAGAVAYAYRIGRYEISERMINAANALGGLGITQINRGPDKPATDVSWYEAAQFVNWLNTSTGHAPAYKFDGAGAFQLWTPADAGYDPANLFRNARAKYFLPSMDEWYKAAFYDPQAGVYWDYPNGRDTPPQPVASGTDDNTAVYNQAGPADVYLAGGPSPFGTVGQVGNVAEWDETEADLVNDDVLGNRGIRGASWLTLTTPPRYLLVVSRWHTKPRGARRQRWFSDRFDRIGAHIAGTCNDSRRGPAYCSDHGRRRRLLPPVDRLSSGMNGAPRAVALQTLLPDRVMIRLLAACCFALSISLVHCAAAQEAAYPPQVSLETIQQRVSDCSPAHPRLFASATQLGELAAAAQGDPLLAQVAETVIDHGNRLLVRPPVERVMTGRRLLHVSRECSSRTLTLSMAFHLTEDPRYVQRCQDEMLAAARFTDWNPSHFLDTAEMTLALAIGYDWLHDQLDDAAREEIRAAIVAKGLDLQFNSQHTGWVRATNNWGQVCHGGMVAGAVAVLEDEPDLAARTLHSAVHNVVRAMNQFAPHGGYPEGPSYWRYGTGFNVMLIAALDSALGDDFGLTAAPGFSETGGYLALMTGPAGEFYNYADGNARRSFEPSLYWFAGRFDRPDWLRGERDRLKDALAAAQSPRAGGLAFLPLTLLWAPGVPAADSVPVELPLSWSSGGATPVTVHRSSWDDATATWVGVKGGSPSDSHGHMDVGSFVLDADGVRWAQEVGREGYHGIESRGMNLWSRVQNSDRWTIFRLNNFSHNTLVIDDQLQTAAGRGTLAEFSAEPQSTILDLSDAYRGQVESAVRGIFLLPNGEVLIQDELTGLKPGSRVRWAMATRGTPDATGADVAVLSQGDKRLTLTARAPAGATWQEVDISQPVHEWDSPNPGVRLMVLEQQAPADGKLTFAVIATPGSCEDSVATNLAIEPLSK